MRGLKDEYIELSRYRPAFVGFALLVFLAVMVGSCDEVERHKVLDYFFDGVPPPGQEGFKSRPLDPNFLPVNQTGQAPVWYTHEPIKNCTNCHPGRASGRLSAQAYLNNPVPKLCYNCHDDFTVKGPFLHGPVIIGQCTFCHNPHKSKIKHLLKTPEPKLCYLCHDVSLIELIPAHLPQQTSACTDCHNPHVGSTGGLLKGPPTNTQDKEEQPLDEPSPRKPVMAPEQHETLDRQQKETAELYYRSMQFYREGELIRARDGFVKVLESGLIPAPMADTLRTHIVNIDNRLAMAQIHSKYNP